MSELAGFFRFTQFSFTHMQWNECIQRRAVHTVDIAEKKNKADIDGICFLILFTKNKFRTAEIRKPFLSQQDNVKPHSRITTAWLCSKEVWVLCSYLLLPTEHFLCHMKHQVRMGETLGYRTYMSRGFPTALLKVVMNMPALQLEHVPAFVLLASKT